MKNTLLKSTSVLIALLMLFLFAGVGASAEETLTIGEPQEAEINVLDEVLSVRKEINKSFHKIQAPQSKAGRNSENAVGVTVFVNGKEMNKTNNVVKCGSGTATLDTSVSPAKLTLKNATVESYPLPGSYTAAACIATDYPLNICVEGENNIAYDESSYTGFALSLVGTTTISGSGNLKITFLSNYPGLACGVAAENLIITDNVEIEIIGGGLSCATGSAAVVSANSNGVGSIEVSKKAYFGVGAYGSQSAIGVTTSRIITKDSAHAFVLANPDNTRGIGISLSGVSGTTKYIDIQGTQAITITSTGVGIMSNTSFSFKNCIVIGGNTDDMSDGNYGKVMNVSSTYYLGNGSKIYKNVMLIPKSTTVELKMNDGTDTTYKTIKVDVMGKYGELGTPSRKGYIFDGWYTEASGGTKITATTVCEKIGSVKLYAHWKYDGKTAYLNANGGSCAASSVEFLSGEKIELPTPKKSGYTFLGWYTAAEGGTQVKNGSTFTGANGVTLYAHWAVNPTADTRITVPEGKKVDYRSKVKFAVSASNLPADCSLAVYNGSVLAVKGEKGAASVEYTSEELKAEITYTVKVLDTNGNVCLDSDGDPLAKEITVKVNRSFIKKIVAFFKSLFGTLPTINL